ncbi:hypothetical protein F4777DRAFT_583147 [Nemania sp. FL0916]|nr:hypothetical protein F4777DRAFT_583147 [Nemania sp. FL0916]
MIDYVTAVLAGLPPPYEGANLLTSGLPPIPSLTTSEPAELSEWQRRWNNEWLNEAYIPYIRRVQLLMERIPNCEANLHLFHRAAAKQEANEPKERKDTNAMSARDTSYHVAVRMLASKAKRLWGRWGKHRDKANKWQVVAVMEEHGGAPRWTGEMKITFRDGALENAPRRPIDLPSSEDIKWLWVTAPWGETWLQGRPQTQHWGPFLRRDSCIPFVSMRGEVVRNCKPEAHLRADGDVFDNFKEPRSRP